MVESCMNWSRLIDMKFKQFLAEKEKDKKKKEPKIIFVETDPQEAFPNDTVSSLQKFVNKECKDLEKQWKSASELLDFVFDEYKVPKPLAYQKKRWEQYTGLLGYTVKNLHDSRGMKASWVTT